MCMMRCDGESEKIKERERECKRVGIKVIRINRAYGICVNTLYARMAI